MQFVIAMLCLLSSRVNAATVENKHLEDTDLPKCAIDSEDAGECLKTVMNALTWRLKDGDPELGIPAYDPLVLDQLSLQYSSGVASARVSVRNVKLDGFAQSVTQQVNFKTKGDKIKFRIVLHLPKVIITGKYRMEIQVNSLQLKPKGDFNLTLSDVDLNMVVDGKFVTKDERRFLRLTDIDGDPKIRDLTIKANGIFGDPELDELALNVANSYWRDVYGLVLPETRSSWAPVLLRIANEALTHVPLDQFVKRLE